MEAPSLSTDNLCHAAKGSGYFCGVSLAAAALATLAAVVTAIALGLLIGKGFIIYSVGAHTPLQLAWVLPVTLVFFVVDALLIFRLSKLALSVGEVLSEYMHVCGGKMLDHFQAIRLSST